MSHYKLAVSYTLFLSCKITLRSGELKAWFKPISIKNSNYSCFQLLIFKHVWFFKITSSHKHVYHWYLEYDMYIQIPRMKQNKSPMHDCIVHLFPLVESEFWHLPPLPISSLLTWPLIYTCNSHHCKNENLLDCWNFHDCSI